ncbi:hypothetical protein NQ318_021471 [Aromia moschata]|uniref:Uncharacterized protein n=1 Tax=Aromia moschata TaxID=1265417 RepID=A0AAV8ZC22_9CUCU|nr:hypothetical protein NQ318_021471 [Aromia moschata]
MAIWKLEHPFLCVSRPPVPCVPLNTFISGFDFACKRTRDPLNCTVSIGRLIASGNNGEGGRIAAVRLCSPCALRPPSPTSAVTDMIQAEFGTLKNTMKVLSVQKVL